MGGWKQVEDRLGEYGWERRCRYCEDWWPIEFYQKRASCRLGEQAAVGAAKDGGEVMSSSNLCRPGGRERSHV